MLSTRELAPGCPRVFGDADPTHPLPSPEYADLRELPPPLIQVGEDEILLDDARSLVERAYSAGVDATLEVWPGLWHVFQTMLVLPEARRATERLARFLGREHPDRTDDLNCDGCE